MPRDLKRVRTRVQRFRTKAVVEVESEYFDDTDILASAEEKTIAQAIKDAINDELSECLVPGTLKMTVASRKVFDQALLRKR